MKLRFTANFARTVAAALCLFIGSANAQNGFFKDNSGLYTSFGIGGGSAHYAGDLTSLRNYYYAPYTNVRWNVTGNYTKYLNPNFGIRASFTWVRLYGDDFTFAGRNINRMYKYYVRNLHFRNDLQEFAVSGIWNLRRPYWDVSQTRPKFMPYFSLGIGFAAHDPKAVPRDTTVWVSLRKYDTGGQNLPSSNKKTYSSVTPVIPITLGGRWRLAQNLDLGFEAGLRWAFTDYLDDVSGQDAYPDFEELESNNGYRQAAVDLSYRANEDYHAVSGKSRIDDFVKAAGILSPTTSGISTPANSAELVYPHATNTRGEGNNFYHRFDQYFTTQITLNYVISNRIKCPVPK